MTYLLGVTVGPVQSNIQKSKKLIDLRNSSRIISDIMIKVLEYLKNNVDKQIEIIYPDINNDINLDLTNYLICEIHTKEGLGNMKKAVFDEFKIEPKKITLEEVYFMFWAVEPLETYDRTYNKLVKKLRSIKNTYEFKNYEETNTGKKCSLCGERVRINDKDKLCDLCNFKRSYKNLRYKSVYEISIAPWKDKNKNELNDVTEKLESVFKNTEKYYSLDTVSNLINLSEPNIFKRIREEKEINEDLIDYEMDDHKLIEELRDIKIKLEEIYLRKGTPVIKPHYKYCFFQMDVDDLGKWMSGKWNIENSELRDRQKEISQALSKFAYEIRQKFEDSKIAVIYAGGDDFLAILPVEMLLEALRIIEKGFKEIVQDRLEESNNYKKKITYSAGITLISCKDDMALALRQNRMTLEKAKERFKDIEPSKNSIGISYIVNSNKIVNMYLSKPYFQQYVNNLERWRNIKDNTSFAYIDAIENEFSKIKFEKLEIEESMSIIEMMELEFKRYLSKNKPQNNTEDFEEYSKLHIELFKNIIRENIIDEKFDFSNIINCYRIYEKLTEFDFSSKGGESNETAKNKAL
ncbi:Cas10/Cmr2 second palm domain-containing protein [Desnuesiella massiliensis]|uniref:Cas10/Cmr2 second palm domain-containing protein n=1 Tax=Desnuesiella massiliensis TaxID=1650662 RepID=UPI0006E1583D|nr:type III-B CRISPR-associated protein Cas10/Cmr2 [Desnuesiella massiliensis]